MGAASDYHDRVLDRLVEIEQREKSKPAGEADPTEGRCFVRIKFRVENTFPRDRLDELARVASEVWNWNYHVYSRALRSGRAYPSEYPVNMYMAENRLFSVQGASKIVQCVNRRYRVKTDANRPTGARLPAPPRSVKGASWFPVPADGIGQLKSRGQIRLNRKPVLSGLDAAVFNLFADERPGDDGSLRYRCFYGGDFVKSDGEWSFYAKFFITRERYLELLEDDRVPIYAIDKMARHFEPTEAAAAAVVETVKTRRAAIATGAADFARVSSMAPRDMDLAKWVNEAADIEVAAVIAQSDTVRSTEFRLQSLKQRARREPKIKRRFAEYWRAEKRGAKPGIMPVPFYGDVMEELENVAIRRRSNAMLADVTAVRCRGYVKEQMLIRDSVVELRSSPTAVPVINSGRGVNSLVSSLESLGYSGIELVEMVVHHTYFAVVLDYLPRARALKAEALTRLAERSAAA